MPSAKAAIEQFKDCLGAMVGSIVEDFVKTAPPIDAGDADRPGAALGGRLADAFVEGAKQYPSILHPQAAPPEKTKNPWDARFTLSQDGLSQEVWLDFKALDQRTKDSNPDSGSLDKFSKFLAAGNLYFIFVRTYFDRNADGRIVYVKRDGKWCQILHLQDIPADFRRTAANQIQMNAYASPKLRTKDAFLTDLYDAAYRDYTKEIERLRKKLAELEETKATVKKAVSAAEVSLGEQLDAQLRSDSTWCDRLTMRCSGLAIGSSGKDNPSGASR
jgi:hypothetical protein